MLLQNSQVLNDIFCDRDDVTDSRKAQQINITGRNGLQQETRVLDRPQPILNGAAGAMLSVWVHQLCFCPACKVVLATTLYHGVPFCSAAGAKEVWGRLVYKYFNIRKVWCWLLQYACHCLCARHDNSHPCILSSNDWYWG